METREIVSEIEHIMSDEIGLLERFCEAENELKRAIVENEWDSIERVIHGMKPIAAELEKVEWTRHDRFTALRNLLGEPEGAGFYQVAVRLPQQERESLADHHRRLKLTVLRIQAIGWTIDTHVRTISLTIHQILDELFPYRRGKIYSRRGDAAPARSNPMILNHSL